MINLFYLIPATALLWIPRQKLRFRRLGTDRSSRSRITDPNSMREPGDLGLRPGEEFTKVRNYVDLLRGVVGSYGVMQFGLSADTSMEPQAKTVIFAIQAFILLAAVLAQTLRWDGRLLLQAPVFFLTGIASGVCGIECAFYGSAAAWVVNAILKDQSSFLLAQGLLIGAFGAFFHGPSDRMVVIAGFLTVLPAIIGFILRRPLAIGTRHSLKGF